MDKIHRGNSLNTIRDNMLFVPREQAKKVLKNFVKKEKNEEESNQKKEKQHI